ncbi:MAG: hypothetical protein ACI3XG_03380 [Faecousia sp.]
MMEKLKGWMNSRRYNSHLMRLIVGGYVAYLGGKIIVNQYHDGAFSLPLTLCAILLIVLAAPVALISLYAVFNGYSAEYKGKTSPADSSQEEPEESEEPEE